MSVKTDLITTELPLSWTRTQSKTVRKSSFRFWSNKMHWISMAHIPEQDNFEQIISDLQESHPQGILLRGCSQAIANELQKRNFEVLPFGLEAVIDLGKPVFNTRSLRQSARSGKRHNTFRKIKLTPENNRRLAQLKKASVHGHKPQLKNLFIDTFSHHTECFIAENGCCWNAAITFSRVNIHKVQAELLLRRSSAASGTMEALLEYLFFYLKEKGYVYFSLGEVPFQWDDPKQQTPKSRLIRRTGRAFHFAYNSASLYSFKNKFSPVWQPVYLCGYPKVSLLSLVEMGIRTNYLRLIISQAYYHGKQLIEEILTRGRIN